MDNNTAGPAIPLSFVTSRKTGLLQTTGTTPGTDTIVVFDVNDFSFLNGIIDRPLTTNFRALIAGFYRVNYNIQIMPSANDRGAAVNVILNGSSDILSLRSFGTAGKAATFREGRYTNSQIIQLAVNDILTVGVDPIESAAVDILPISSFGFELVRPI